MGAVFLLWYSRPLEDGLDENDTDDKLVGVYSSAAEVMQQGSATFNLRVFATIPIASW